ncbi:MAG: YidB family protein [Acetobacteraceae bacterium]
MGKFDGVLTGLIGGEMATVVNDLIAQHGGVQGLVQQLHDKGLGDAAKSWVGTGPNQSLTLQQVHQAFGSQMISDLAAKAGMNPQDLAQKLSYLLPQAVDRLTPGGLVPKY